jgi:hypothetical protein
MNLALVKFYKSFGWDFGLSKEYEHTRASQTKLVQIRAAVIHIDGVGGGKISPTLLTDTVTA